MKTTCDGTFYTLPNDHQFNWEFQFKSVFKLEIQAEFGIQLGILILMGINLRECNTHRVYKIFFMEL